MLYCAFCAAYKGKNELLFFRTNYSFFLRIKLFVNLQYTFTV